MNNSCSSSNCYGEGLILYSAILAIIISRNLNTDEIDLLSTLLQAVGQNMAILSSANSSCDNLSNSNNSSTNITDTKQDYS